MITKGFISFPYKILRDHESTGENIVSLAGKSAGKAPARREQSAETLT
jgi:hypothetical protein